MRPVPSAVRPSAPPPGVSWPRLRGGFGLAPDLRATIAVRVPEGEDVYALTMWGPYVAWAGGERGRHHYPADMNILDSALHQVDVLDTRTMRVRVFPASRPDAIVAPLGGTGDWLVWLDEVPVSMSHCDGGTCASWTIYARNLTTGAVRVLDSSDGRPEGERWTPDVVVAEGHVAWQRRAASGVGTVEYLVARVDRGRARVVYRDSGSSQLNISRGVLYFDGRAASAGRRALLALPLGGGPARELVTDTDLRYLRVIGTRVAWTAPAPDGRRTLKVTELTDKTLGGYPLTEENDIYSAAWVRDDTVIIETEAGLRLVREPRTARQRVVDAFRRPPPVGLARPYVDDAGRLVFVTHDSDRDARLPNTIVIAEPAG